MEETLVVMAGLADRWVALAQGDSQDVDRLFAELDDPEIVDWNCATETYMDLQGLIHGPKDADDHARDLRIEDMRTRPTLDGFVLQGTAGEASGIGVWVPICYVFEVRVGLSRVSSGISTLPTQHQFLRTGAEFPRCLAASGREEPGLDRSGSATMASRKRSEPWGHVAYGR